METKYFHKLSLSLLLSCFCFSAAAENPAKKEGTLPQLSYVRVYNDSEGESHFGEGKLTIVPAGQELSANTISADYLKNMNGGTFYFAPANADSDGQFHAADQRQLVIVLTGDLDVLVSDGEVRKAGPGDVFMLEDTSGKGHGAIFRTDHLMYTIPMPAN